MERSPPEGVKVALYEASFMPSTLISPRGWNGAHRKPEQARAHLTAPAAMYGEIEMRFWFEEADTEMREPE